MDLLEFVEATRKNPAPAPPRVATPRKTAESPETCASGDMDDRHELLPMSAHYEYLVWPDSPVFFRGLTRLRTPFDEDCFYHAILNATLIGYRTRRLGSVDVDARDIVRLTRSWLATSLGTPDSTGVRPYDRLDNGTVSALSSTIPSCTLAAFQHSLLHGTGVRDVLLPFVCDMINHDIFLVNAHERDLHVVSTMVDVLYRDRPAIVLLYTPQHYSLLAVRTEDRDLQTRFDPKHPYVQQLRKRLDQVCVLEPASDRGAENNKLGF